MTFTEETRYAFIIHSIFNRLKQWLLTHWTRLSKASLKLSPVLVPFFPDEGFSFDVDFESWWQTLAKHKLFLFSI